MANSLSEGLLAMEEGAKAAASHAEVALGMADASQMAGVRDVLILDEGEQRAVGKGGYEYMFAIRLPKTAKKKKKEQEVFAEYKKKHCEAKSTTVQALLNKLMVSADEKVSSTKQDGETSNEIQCDETLEGTLNCVIGMLLSFFKTISDSHDAPIEILKFNSVETNKMFICTRLSPKLAEKLADMAEYAVQLSEDGVSKMGIELKDTNLVPAFVKFDEVQKENGYLVIQPRADKPNEETVLNHIDRIRLFYDKLTDHMDFWELVQMLQPLNITMKMFPIHDEVELQKLQTNWANWRMYVFLSQPINDIRNYYGEEIAFYFLFTETMRKGLLVLLLLTLVFWNQWTNLALPYSIVIVAWLAGLEKYWKRKEAHMANVWGSDYTHTSAAVKDLINPDFEGEELPSDLDASHMEKKADPRKQMIGKIISFVVGSCFVCIVTCGVVLNRWAISQEWISRTLGNLLVSVQIKVFGITWAVIVPKLTAGEHHLTLRALGQSNALYTFVFLFFNTFNAFLWIAYVSPSYDPEACLAPGLENGCRGILHTSLVQAFPVLVVFAVLSMVAPFYNIWQKFRKQANDLKELAAKGDALPAYTISSMEMQTKMLDFTEADIADVYMQVISSIAFVAMWVVAAPVTTCILAYVAVSVQHGVDAYRFTQLYQRPFPNRVASIGIWNGVLKFLKYASIVNLSGLLVTNPQVDIAGIFGLLPKECHVFAYSHTNSSMLSASVANGTLPPQCTMTEQANLLVFFLVLVFLIGGVALFDALVPDVGPITVLNKKRQDYQRAKLFDIDLQEFHESVVLSGHSNWEESNYHATEVTPQLKPDDPLYVKCVTIGA